MAKQLGYVLERKLSPLDGKPIVVIMTIGKSTNTKTGDMIQTYILREDLSPVEAIKLGEDFSICGDCPHRRKYNPLTDKYERSCYVNAGQGPLSVWKAYKAGRYKMLWTNEELETAVSGRKVRWGTYGDPSLCDPKIVRWLNKYNAGHTGYTHQWRQEWAQVFQGIFQASCDGFSDYLNATETGWRTFSVVPKGYTPNKIKLCPATVSNSQAQCVTCSLCDGAKADIYVEAHGSGGKYVLSIA